MKNQITLILVLISVMSFSQEKDKYGFDYSKIENERIFLPTWNNIFNSVTMPTEIFEQLMTEYNYNKNDKDYIKNIKNTFLSIKKNKKEIIFYWVSTSINTNNIENEFAEFYKKTEKGVKIYTLDKGNKKITLKIKNKEEIGGYLQIQFN